MSVKFHYKAVAEDGESHQRIHSALIAAYKASEAAEKLRLLLRSLQTPSKPRLSLQGQEARNRMVGEARKILKSGEGDVEKDFAENMETDKEKEKKIARAKLVVIGLGHENDKDEREDRTDDDDSEDNSEDEDNGEE
ncbi:hypothetical protein L211DRAFT_848852 [Terfezia boudieri ATCC MYA-4762]|uniref:Uncharacterized protein n=1 Tax=Terfezia boudieri ATCC MYA-4762 TaxID=1051890 RepID=A0A3N4LNS8_9PEZI|nr:hypothetical protein L211DRAFT_848852 [Terfezia boudieri ATCC MYA-4762]